MKVTIDTERIGEELCKMFFQLSVYQCEKCPFNSKCDSTLGTVRWLEENADCPEEGDAK